MTKQEYKMILKLIDRNTKMEHGYYDDYPNIDEAGIEQLKQDIKDLFEESDE